LGRTAPWLFVCPLALKDNLGGLCGGSLKISISLTRGGSVERWNIFDTHSCIRRIKQDGETYTVNPPVTTGLTYDQLGLRPKFLFWLTTKSRVTTRASANVVSTYPMSHAVHCKHSWCLLCFAGATMLIPLIKVCTVETNIELQKKGVYRSRHVLA
jgi:hypothetical protein